MSPAPNYILWPLLAMLVVSGVFWFVPEIDLWAAAHFYEAGRGFDGRSGIWGALYHLVPYVVGAVVVLVLGLAGAGWLRRQPIWGIHGKAALYLLLTLALGPGLMVNTVFKDQWGRARPHQIEQFGGEKQYTPVWVISDQCDKNCSFVSGHASVGYYLMAFGLLWSAYRKPFMIAGAAGGLLVGMARIAQGGHFLSDVLLCGFVVYWVALVCYGVLYRRWP